MHPIEDFSSGSAQAFHSSGVGELVPGLSGKIETPTCSSRGHLKTFDGQIRIQIVSTKSRRSGMHGALEMELVEVIILL